MRIAHLTSVHPRYDTRIFLKECTSLANAGFEVNLIVADGQGNEVKNGVHILDAGGKNKSRIRRMKQTVNRVVKKAIETNPDVYHLHDPELLRLVPELLKHGKVIYDVHEDLPRQIISKYWIPKFLRRSIAFISKIIENHYAGKTNGIITATPFIEERFARVNQRVVNINNFPKLEEFREIEQTDSGERLVCYVGVLASVRGIFEMVKAMEFVDGKLLLAGLFSNPAEREKIEKLPGWEKVLELGFCDREKVRKVLSTAKVGLVVLHPTPNYVDALPVKLFEYMASELPVIASDFPLLREIIDSAQCGICVDPLDPNQIADAINWIFDKPLDALKMGKAGKNATKRLYNWKIEENKLLNFYQSINSQDPPVTE